jgi:hypothetical protein
MQHVGLFFWMKCGALLLVGNKIKKYDGENLLAFSDFMLHYAMLLPQIAYSHTCKGCGCGSLKILQNLECNFRHPPSQPRCTGPSGAYAHLPKVWRASRVEAMPRRHPQLGLFWHYIFTWNCLVRVLQPQSQRQRR